MKPPRDVSGEDLVKALGRLGYARARQRGSHASLFTQTGGEHHIVIPMHGPLNPGALNSILHAMGTHKKLARDELLHQLRL